METTIPFSGFYEAHSHVLDDALSLLFTDDQGELVSSVLLERAESQADWRAIREGNCKAYLDGFVEEYGIEVTFKLLDSPKYYNYDTDRIFAEISLDEVKRLYKAVRKGDLNTVIKDKFTSHSGFSSHYPNDIREWSKDLSTWDHNQIGTLIEAYIEYNGNYEFDFDFERGFISNPYEELYTLFYDNIKGIDKLHKLFTYLRERANR